ncbi:MAG: hypothetical protein K8Q99_00550 [Acholeplasmataceae bacterium]|nr:hypothetical protein [Acholeplasmataceae bacterium]
MKKYVERYIYDVVRRLPKEMQDDVKEELNAHIYDMLDENPTDEDIDHVLHELGSPRKIANNYKENKRYVISPLFYEDYIRVLKLAFIIIVSIALVISAIEAAIHINEITVFKTIVAIAEKIIEDVSNAIVTTFFFVTIIFWLIDRFQYKVNPNDWKIKDLPDLPDIKSSKISRTQSIIGLIFHTIFSTIFIVIALRYVDIIGWYTNDVLVARLFNDYAVNPFIIFFIISAVIGFIVQMLKIYYKKWNKELAISYTVYQILSVTLMLLFINQSDLVTTAYLAQLSLTMVSTVVYLQNGLKNILIWITVIVSALTIVDLISIWLKTLRPKSEHKKSA